MHALLPVVICSFLCALAGAATAQTISGTVQERGSGEAVIGANVVVTGTRNGASTNRYGHFTIAGLDTGSYTLRVSAMGFGAATVAVHLTAQQRDARLSIDLEAVALEQQEVLVEGERRGEQVKPVGTIDVPMEQILRLPSLGGESDIFRALQLLPGVKSSSELSSGLYIRGGSPDQNLVLLDRMVLYNPTHLGGFLSTFNADAVNHVRLIKGAMPAEYGGRLSSVVDVTMREGNREAFHGSGGVSMIDSRLTLEGPATEDITWMVAGRRVYLDWLVGALSEESLPYYFYDLLAKTNIRLGENDRLYFSGFFGRDVLGEGGAASDFDIFWGNTAGNLRWTHVFGSTLFGSMSAVVSDYRFNTRVRDDYDNSMFKSVSGILDYSLRAEVEYVPNPLHAVKAGAEATLHTFTSEASSIESEFPDLEKYLPSYRGTELSLYAQDEWKVSEQLTANIGGRLFWFDKSGSLRAEPRISAYFRFEEGTTLTAAVAGANQFLHLVSRNDLSLPTDMWFPSTSNIRPAWGMQYVLGAQRDFLESEWGVSLEVYYKIMENVLEFRDNARFSLFAPVESEVTSGRGTAYGGELFVQKKLGAITGWIGYTLAWADRTFPELNDGKTFPPRYDRRHDISIVANYRLGKTWEFTAVWVYGTGQAFTFPVAQYSLGGFFDAHFLYSERNGYRLPAYHRLDLNFSHAFSWFGWQWKASINVYNAYNHYNPFSQYIKREEVYDPVTGRSTSRNTLTQSTILPFLPTAGLSFVF
ncbi:MAG: TonB-dependent receptor [Ignavibacteria bacterium]|nr:TonB-dependent receptor [Ignavibacteria bacterium]